MKKVLFLLIMIPLTFAAPWHTIAGITLTISAAILGIIFAVGYGFGIQEMRIMAKEELYQLLAFGVMLVAFAGGDGILNAISTNPAFIVEGESTSMQETAALIVDENLHNAKEVFDQLSIFDHHISREASKAGSCNIMQMGYSVSGCGGFTILAAPLSLAGSMTGFAIGELAAIKRLIEVSDAYAMLVILPLGILLRTLKFTRGAGGLLIAFAIALHIMLPLGIIFSEMLSATFLDDSEAGSVYGPDTSVPELAECSASDAGPDIVTGASDNEIGSIETFYTMKSRIRKYIFHIFVNGSLGPLLSLILVVSSIKTITSIAGAEVDVSAISRFV